CCGTQALYCASSDQPADRRCPCRSYAGRGKDTDTDEHRALAPHCVGHRTIDNLGKPECQQVCRQCQSHGRFCCSQVSRNLRQGREVHVDCEGPDGCEQAQHECHANE